MTGIENDLRFIYGEEIGPRIAGELRHRLQEWREAQKAKAQARTRTKLQDASGAYQSLTERDVLLITYGDQVTETGKPPLRTLHDFLHEHLSRIVSGVHLLPFYPSSSDDGFAVRDFFAVDPALGSWDDVAAIGENFELMLDAVFNHISAQSEWFHAFLQANPKFRNFFITVNDAADLSCVVRPRALPLLTEFTTSAGREKVWTTFSADQVDLNFKNPEVLLAVVDALLFYVENGARLIRLDAIAYLWKEIGTSCIHLPQTHRIVQLFRKILDQVAPRVLLVTETNVPHADNLSYFGDGANEAQLVYNFALPPLVLHSLTTGNAEALTRWATGLSLPTDKVSFFNFLASHDGIGINPVRGILSNSEIEALVRLAQDHGGFVSWKKNTDGSESPYELNINYFDALSNPDDRAEQIKTRVDRFIAAQAIMLALVGVPGIYFHSMFGSRNDRAGADASNIPRRINRQKFTREGLEHELADRASLRSQVLSRFKHLITIRRSQPAFHPNAIQHVLVLDSRVFAFLRTAPNNGQVVLCVHNISNQTMSLAFEIPGIEHARWVDLTRPARAFVSEYGKTQLDLEPYNVCWAMIADVQRELTARAAEFPCASPAS
jgi:glycosidase